MSKSEFVFEFNKEVEYNGEVYYCKMINYIKNEVLIDKSYSAPEWAWGNLWISTENI